MAGDEFDEQSSIAKRQVAQDSLRSETSIESMVTVRPLHPDSIKVHPLHQVSTHSKPLSEGNDTKIQHDSLPLEETNQIIDQIILTSLSHVEFGTESQSATSSPDCDFQVEDPEVLFSDMSGEHVRPRSSSSGTTLSKESTSVDWDELEKTEVQEPRDEGSDESTTFLLARLEQENQALVTDPKSGLKATRKRRQSRPPSIQQLKMLVDSPTTPSLRYSLLPTPPPMTELEFWAALVSDYPQTTQRLPTLTSKKIRGGVPPPLRGVVWQSLSASRDQLLEKQFEKLSLETSPYENLIGKDIGRTFPTVDLFRDADGEGQRMLGRVLKCFSLYDQKIGYCQGLGFLVGPLLLHMGEKEAFCVLVRLMEQYDLRSCFTPDLSGLHLRIYQFTRLLAQHLPDLSTHLENLHIEPLYLSQWFLSFFAVTCPLPMLLRIYDVIFAEGASETLMRTALSLMRRNQKKILGCSELEDVMQLLLSRGLWDCYGCNADDLVNDFVGLTGLVTHDGLKGLETAFHEAQHEGSAAKANSLPNLQAAASRFLGKFWAGSHSTCKSVTLSPPLSAPRPISFLRRSPSKQSLTSTLNSCEGGSESGFSSVPTEATTMSRQASADYSVAKPISGSTVMVGSANRKATSSKDKDLHCQIEDLLTAMNEMQRAQAVLKSELQKEREQREEDHECVGSFVRRLEDLRASGSVGDTDLVGMRQVVQDIVVDSSSAYTKLPIPVPYEILNKLKERFVDHSAKEGLPGLSSKHQLCDELANAKGQADLDAIKIEDLNRKLSQESRENSQLRDQLKEARARIQESFNEKQRKGKASQALRLRNPSSAHPQGQFPAPANQDDAADEASSLTVGGLRDFKLGRADTPTQSTPTFSKRTSSLSTQAILATANHQPAPEDTLLIELVNAKTAEAVAKQELEEMKGKLESLRKMCGVSSRAVPGHRPSPSEPNIERGMTLGPLTTNLTDGGPQTSNVTPPSASTSGFWGWGKWNTSSTVTPESR